MCILFTRVIAISANHNTTSIMILWVVDLVLCILRSAQWFVVISSGKFNRDHQPISKRHSVCAVNYGVISSRTEQKYSTRCGEVAVAWRRIYYGIQCSLNWILCLCTWIRSAELSLWRFAVGAGNWSLGEGFARRIRMRILLHVQYMRKLISAMLLFHFVSLKVGNNNIPHTEKYNIVKIWRSSAVKIALSEMKIM